MRAECSITGRSYEISQTNRGQFTTIFASERHSKNRVSRGYGEAEKSGAYLKVPQRHIVPNELSPRRPLATIPIVLNRARL